MHHNRLGPFCRLVVEVSRVVETVLIIQEIFYASRLIKDRFPLGSRTAEILAIPDRKGID